MLRKQQRLKSGEIPHLVRRGRRVYSEDFELRMWWDNKFKEPAFAVSVSTTVDKRAVVRNRIRRKFKSVIKDLIEKGAKFRNGKYLIIVRSAKIVDVPIEDLSKLLYKAVATN